jgi:hypothetical protein
MVACDPCCCTSLYPFLIADEITLEVSQERVKRAEEERTEITIEYYER